MQDLNIALLQFDQVWENKAANWSRIEQLLVELPSSVDLLILPEMFDTGFSMNTSLAENWETQDSSIAFLKEISASYKIAIYTSIMVKEKEDFFNRGVFIESDGNFQIYDKRKTFGLGKEDQYYKSGENEMIVNFRGWNLNLQICYDLRFPELVRNRIEDGNPIYDVLIYVANWPEKRIEHWKTLLMARAIENQCYVIGVNRIGVDGNQLKYSGDSLVYSALGQVMVSANDSERIHITQCNSNDLRIIRDSLPFLKDR